MKQASIIPLLKYQGTVSPFKVQTIQNFILEQENTGEAPHSHNYYEMIWLIKGSGTLYVDMQEYAIADNTIFCIKPDQTHRFQTQMEMEGFVFSFTDTIFKMDEYDFNWASQASISRLFSQSRTVRIENEMKQDCEEIILKM